MLIVLDKGETCRYILIPERGGGMVIGKEFPAWQECLPLNISQEIPAEVGHGQQSNSD